MRKWITRRGDTITTNFDTRNRDTLSVVPGIGTLRRTFAGPLDQLTRMWFDSPVDPIGGVNGEVRYAYDQRSRLVAETTYTGATARATSFAYDGFERLSTMTDALGTWTMRYETDRGYADTLLTPMGDTITYVFDRQSRPSNMKIQGGGAPLHRSRSWGPSGVLGSLANGVYRTPTKSYMALSYANSDGSDNPPARLILLEQEQHDTMAAFDVFQDTASIDAHGRVTSWESWRNSSLIADETYGFNDQNDLLSAAGETYTYDATTRRVTSRSTATGTWNYMYDRAGNLIQSTLGGTTWVYTYDALNRLTSATRNSTLIARYAYDAIGRRISKRVYSSVSGGTVGYTRFVYHGHHVGFDTDSVGTTIGLRYTWGREVDDLAAVRDASGNHYYAVQDALHSVRGLVRRDGTWTSSSRYASYGTGLDSAGTAPVALRYRWTGREFDSEVGFYYFRARYYDPALRRFIQEDPIGYAGGPSLYGYVVGNPFVHRDPWGLDYELGGDGCTWWTDSIEHGDHVHFITVRASCPEPGGGGSTVFSNDDGSATWGAKAPFGGYSQSIGFTGPPALGGPVITPVVKQINPSATQSELEAPALFGLPIRAASMHQDASWYGCVTNPLVFSAKDALTGRTVYYFLTALSPVFPTHNNQWIPGGMRWYQGIGVIGVETDHSSGWVACGAGLGFFTVWRTSP